MQTLMQKKAFTLIELLVVISVIALLMAILIPSLAKARQQARRICCLSNLRQLVIAANSYTAANDDYYPVAQYWKVTAGRFAFYCWDFTTIFEAGKKTVLPGMLWQQMMMEQIQQCPSFKGQSNTAGDPYTGYNYNTSYIGHGKAESIEAPAKIIAIKKPSRCALFGDGQFKKGANKYMRAPWPNPGDVSFSSRWAGAQGYRHNGRTNIAWADGHASSQKQLYTDTKSSKQQRLIEEYNKTEPKNRFGFLSPDNSAYDLE